MGSCLTMRLNVSNILGSSGETAISFGTDSTGLPILSFPSQPCFSAEYVSATKTGSGNPRVVRYENTFININNHYNSGTGRFTAPLLGLYFISFCMRTTGGSSFRDLATIRLNGVTYLEATQESTPGSGADRRTLVASCLMYLNVSDYVEIYSTADTSEDPGNNFSGYLIGR